MATITATATNFDQTINSTDIVFADFWAAWCGPCRRFAPVFEQAAEENPDIAFTKVDTEAEHELAARFGIMSIPTLMVWRDQVLVYAQPGALPAPALGELIDKVRSLDMDDVRRQVSDRESTGAGKVSTGSPAR
ncbi:MAG: thioredoxin [Acidimicrobiales bacterium]